MSLLTEQDRNQLEDGLEQTIGKNAFDAIEAAILAKLASAELPEPDCLLSTNRYGSSPDAYPVYTADQLRQAYARGAAAQLAERPVATVTNNWPSDYSEIGRTYEAPIPIGTPLYTRRQA